MMTLKFCNMTPYTRSLSSAETGAFLGMHKDFLSSKYYCSENPYAYMRWNVFYADIFKHITQYICTKNENQICRLTSDWETLA